MMLEVIIQQQQQQQWRENVVWLIKENEQACDVAEWRTWGAQTELA